VDQIERSIHADESVFNPMSETKSLIERARELRVNCEGGESGWLQPEAVKQFLDDVLPVLEDYQTLKSWHALSVALAKEFCDEVRRRG
jgi:hypothetical protein